MIFVSPFLHIPNPLRSAKAYLDMMLYEYRCACGKTLMLMRSQPTLPKAHIWIHLVTVSLTFFAPSHSGQSVILHDAHRLACITNTTGLLYILGCMYYRRYSGLPGEMVRRM